MGFRISEVVGGGKAAAGTEETEDRAAAEISEPLLSRPSSLSDTVLSPQQADEKMYPTLLTGLAAGGVEQEDEAHGILGRFKSYDTELSSLGAGYNRELEGAKSSKEVAQSWEGFAGKAREIHERYREPAEGPGVSRIFADNYREHLAQEYQHYTRNLQQVTERERKENLRYATDTTLQRLASADASIGELEHFSEKAFNQSCEEAFQSGISEDREILGYARKRLLPLISAKVTDLTDKGSFELAEAYLQRLGDRIEPEECDELFTDISDRKVLEHVNKLAQEENGDKLREYLPGLSSRQRALAGLALRRQRELKTEAADSLRRQALQKVAEEFKKSGVVRPYVLVSGERVRLTPEDYSSLLAAQTESGAERQTGVAGTEGSGNEQRGGGAE